jgi:6-phospho-3-hexuloisomerase
MKINYIKVLSEINSVLELSNFADLENFISKILSARKIVLFGAGRVGLIIKTFAMRLNHLGLDSYYLGEVNLPVTGLGDLMIIGSGSGNTKSVVNIAQIAQSRNLDIISVTANNSSSIASISSSLILLSCQTKETLQVPRYSIQPMTTLFEQALLIFLDSLILELMERLGESNESMSRRHNVIE